MKKTLVAVASLAVAGCAMAQVSVNGTFSFGYKATTKGNAAGTQSSGLGVDQSEIRLSAKEDLGSGQRLEAKLSFAGADRSGESSAQPFATGSNGPVTGRDASLTYTNMSIGQFKLSSAQGGDYFTSVAGLGVSGQGEPLIEMDGKLHELKGPVDAISYTVPVGPVYLNVEHSESGSFLGIGKGSTGGTAQRKNTYSVYYNGGPLTLLGAYRTYDRGLDGLCPDAAGDCLKLRATKDNLYNLQAAYDFGVAKVGLAYQFVNATAGMHQIDTMVSVAAPLGPVIVAASYSTSEMTDPPDTSKFANIGAGGAWEATQYAGKTDGYAFGAKYALSKRTSILARYASWTHSGYSRYEADAPFKAVALQAFGGAAYNYGVAKATFDAAPSAAAGAALQQAGGAMQQAWAAAKAASAGLTASNSANEAGIYLIHTF